MWLRPVVERLRRLGPVGVAGLAAAVAGVFVLARLVVAAEGDASRFVVAGDAGNDVGAVPDELHVFADSDGFDGQYYWRLAVDPASIGPEPVEGVRLDVAYRPARIGYPVLAFVLAGGGRLALVPLALIGVNVAGIAAIAGLGAVLARDAGRHALWGLAFAGFPGLVMTIARDLTEIVTCAALLAGVLAVRRERWLLAGAAWTLAVLTREPAVLVVAAYGLLAAIGPGPGDRPRARHLTWVLPGIAFVGWQLVVRDVWSGDSGARASAAVNLGVPLVGLVRAIPGWVLDSTDDQSLLAPLQLAVIVALVAAAVRWRAAAWVSVAVAATALLAASLDDFAGSGELRIFAEPAVLAWLPVVERAPDRIRRGLAAGQGLVWALTAGLRVIVI